MISGFHERFNPQGIKNRDASASLRRKIHVAE